MNYFQVYHSLIQKARSRQQIEGESHHIIPKSISQYQIANDTLQPFIPDETVQLTTREHFICHLLLLKIFQYVNNNCYQRMVFAAEMMATTRKFTGKQYAWAKAHSNKARSEFLQGKPSRAKGCCWSSEAKANKSKNHYMKGRTYEEIYGQEAAAKLKEKRRNSKPERLSSKGLKFPRTTEQKKNYSESAKQKFKNGFVPPLTDHKNTCFIT